jgi:hypothetical protein
MYVDKLCDLQKKNSLNSLATWSIQDVHNYGDVQIIVQNVLHYRLKVHRHTHAKLCKLKL